MRDEIYWTSNEKEELGEFNIHRTYRKKRRQERYRVFHHDKIVWIEGAWLLDNRINVAMVMEMYNCQVGHGTSNKMKLLDTRPTDFEPSCPQIDDRQNLRDQSIRESVWKEMATPSLSLSSLLSPFFENVFLLFRRVSAVAHVTSENLYALSADRSLDRKILYLVYILHIQFIWAFSFFVLYTLSYIQWAFQRNIIGSKRVLIDLWRLGSEFTRCSIHSALDQN